jgi:hypothetical protein
MAQVKEAVTDNTMRGERRTTPRRQGSDQRDKRRGREDTMRGINTTNKLNVRWMADSTA